MLKKKRSTSIDSHLLTVEFHLALEFLLSQCHRVAMGFCRGWAGRWAGRSRTRRRLSHLLFFADHHHHLVIQIRVEGSGRTVYHLPGNLSGGFGVSSASQFFFSIRIGVDWFLCGLSFHNLWKENGNVLQFGREGAGFWHLLVLMLCFNVSQFPNLQFSFCECSDGAMLHDSCLSS